MTGGARIDPAILERMAILLKKTTASPFDFATPPGLYPPVGHPRALEYFFAVVMHQYGFWHLEDGRWAGSMYADVGGVRLKGSDFVWASASRALAAGERDLTRFLDDSGRCPLPMGDSHEEISRASAEYFARRPPAAILADARSTPSPIQALLAELATVPGYSEDPLRKKAMLLVFALINRPEKFLAMRPEYERQLGPVVDYHVMRTALRTGLVRTDVDLHARLASRRALDPDSEICVRQAVFDAMNELHDRSGASHAALDYLFFQARSKCPEASEPRCPECALDAICGKRKELFQPVIRTTFY